MENFINLYQVQKTLRFKLEPVGKTLENIKKKDLLQKDETLAESYKKMKKTIDAYHKEFIENALKEFTLSSDKLNKYKELNETPKDQRDEKYQKELNEINKELRKEIFNAFKKNDEFKNLFNEKLINNILIEWVKNKNKNLPQDKQLHYDPRFEDFTTYFTGFHENRKNIYSDEEISTAIPYRLIHENLPRFLDNIKIFEHYIKPKLKEDSIKNIETEIKDILGNYKLEDIFKVDFYNHLLTQSGIDFFNNILGGYTKEDGTKVKGLNEHINLYNQKNKDRIPKFKELYKQILSDRHSISFLPDKFKESKDVLDSIRNFYESNLINYTKNHQDNNVNVLNQIQTILNQLCEFDLSKVYVSNKSINDISKKIFGDWATIQDALKYRYSTNITTNTKKASKIEEMIEKYLKQEFYSIDEIHNAIEKYRKTNELVNEKLKDQPKIICSYFQNNDDYLKKIQSTYNNIKDLLNTEYPENQKLNEDKDNVRKIKEFLDALMEYLHFVKPLMITKNNNLEKDENFYSSLEPYYRQLELLIPLYNKVRNYVTQKPYSVEKIKLNFENSTLLEGWDLNKENQYKGVLFKKDNHFYLGIIDKNFKDIFEDAPTNHSGPVYHKMVYKLLPSPNKMLPKVFFSEKNIRYYNPSEVILRIRNHATHTKNGEPQEGFEKGEFNINDCREMIDFYKECIQKHPEWSEAFNFQFKATSMYNSIDEFYRDVEEQGYKISFIPVDENFVNQLVEQGKLYLFKIHNKDFSKNSHGKPNLHTLYWKALFEPDNFNNIIYKLNGNAEVFYRKKSISNLTIHPANAPIKNKNPFNEKKESQFNYEIIKDKRFTQDQFFLHVPITLNFINKGIENINEEILKYIKNYKNVNIIGIDRGERHLLYLTVINSKGEIIHQESLNHFQNKIKTENNREIEIKVDFHQLLNQKEEERNKSRREWGVIENIKELKEGYLSWVIHKIAKLMVEYNAIVVMEDLNTGFKRSRMKVEKQVYQKFEKMLIDKLNYLVFKDREPHQPGGLYKAFQLTNKFVSFEKMGKQNGFLFYVPAWNTSKIDPTTGFVNLFGGIKYENIENSKKFFDKFKTIRFNNEENYFEFEFDYKDFTTKAEGSRTRWTVCTFGNRLINFTNKEKNNNWDTKEINLTEELKTLFNQYQINFVNGQCIRGQIVNQNDRTFFEKLLSLFRLILQMRNSRIGTEEDYLISPVKNDQGYFFDSRNANSNLPQNADANGAYHIALKGLMCIQQIREYNGELKKIKFDISNKKWLEFVQNKK